MDIAPETLRFCFQLVGAAAIATGSSWLTAVRHGSEGRRVARETAKALCDFREQFETFEQALRKRLEDGDGRVTALDKDVARRLTVVETTQTFHARELERGFAEVKAGLVVLQADMKQQFGAMQERLDEAFRAGGR